jgi:polyketide biosynthesis enoyl-CoA hydratase PksI
MDEVVKLEMRDGIAVVKLEEREFRNTFSKRFVYGLKEVFATIAGQSALKVVVVHGYENYFCCGGTKEELLELYEGIGQGKAQFTDLNFHDLLLKCEIPVIAAMQGHALGGGLAFGSFADLIVLAEECIYSANFMKYGFTPGMGATYIIPKKFGWTLGQEMLFSADNYYGKALKERGAPIAIVKKNEVISKAMALAATLADKPVLSLKVLKEHLNREIRAALPGIIEKELAMHKQTFTQPEVLKRIEQLFGN